MKRPIVKKENICILINGKNYEDKSRYILEN